MEGQKKEDNNVYIGNKPMKNYMLALATKVGDDKICIKARGQQISRAVSLAEYGKRIFKLQTKSINIGTEIMQIKDKAEDGGVTERDMPVSTIEIMLEKTGK